MGLRPALGCIWSKCQGIRTRDQLMEAQDRWLTQRSFAGSKATTTPFTARRWKVPASFWGEPVTMVFEGREVPLPREYDVILRSIYGDYMKLPPEEQRRPSHPAKVRTVPDP